MRRMGATLASAALAAGLLAACASPGGSAGQERLTPGDHEVRIRHDGRERSYRVHVPEGLPAPAPVLLAFHGGGGNARQFQEGSAFHSHAHAHGYLVVFPDGTGRGGLHTWNAGECCGGAASGNVDDVGFVRALVEDLARRVPVDRSRIYATGHSNGSMMTHRLAAEASDLVAAIAPYAGAPYFDVLGFAPTHPVPVLHIHSRDDPRALYDGGIGPPFPLTGVRNRMNPVEEQLRHWIDRNGCPAEPTVGPTVPGRRGSLGEGHTATLRTWAPCREGTEVRLLTLTGAGHGWPGEALPRRRERLVGPATDVIRIEAEIWGFVSRFRR